MFVIVQDCGDFFTISKRAFCNENTWFTPVNLYHYLKHNPTTKNIEILEKYQIKHIFNNKNFIYSFKTQSDAQRFINDFIKPYIVLEKLSKCL